MGRGHTKKMAVN